jgi:hypothetical protein
MARVQSTPMVKYALIGLRVYLVLIIVLLGIKCTQMMHEHSTHSTQTMLNTSTPANGH